MKYGVHVIETETNMKSKMVRIKNTVYRVNDSKPYERGGTVWAIQSPGRDEIKTLIYSEELGQHTLWSGRVGLPKLVEVEWLESDPGLFTSGQIEQLRENYDKLKTVPASALDKFHALLGKMTVVQLAQVREAKIRFLSVLAVNEMVRREA